MKPRKSKIWSLTKIELEKLLSEHDTLSGIIRALGLTTKGTANFASLKNKFQEEGVDYSRIKLGLGTNKGRTFIKDKRPIETILIVGSKYNRCHLKNRLIKEGHLDYKCFVCNLTNWCEKPVCLQN